MAIRYIVLEMEQYDCPYVLTSDDVGSMIYVFQWSILENRGLDTRGVIIANDPEELTNTIFELKSQKYMRDLNILSRRGPEAIFRGIIGLTNAMSIISKYGFIMGPFYISRGREIWRVGFDNKELASHALSELDKKNEFRIIQDESINIESAGLFTGMIPRIEHYWKIENLKNKLTPTEKAVLRLAYELGYFDVPKKVDTETISKLLDVSKAAFSKTIRKAEKKIIESILEIISPGKEDFNGIKEKNRRERKSKRVRY